LIRLFAAAQGAKQGKNAKTETPVLDGL